MVLYKHAQFWEPGKVSMVLYKHAHGPRRAAIYNNPSCQTFKVTKKVETVIFKQFSHMMTWAIYRYTKLYTGILV